MNPSNLIEILSSTGLRGVIILFAAFFLSFGLAYLIIPQIIRLAGRFGLVDQPNHRKVHKNPIPTLGGIAVFIAVFITFMLFGFPWMSLQLMVVTGSLALLFITGILDDLKDLSALKKLFIQVVVALVTGYAGLRITSLEGILGIYEIPVFLQYFLTLLIIAGITNAFNLIDGIDGLAGGVSFINATVFGIILAMMGEGSFALLSFILAGALLSFLSYNFNPAKIFMGDTGSLIIGYIMAVLGIKVLESSLLLQTGIGAEAMIVLVVAILILPVYDSLRVFSVRIYHRKSPFSADKTHIHHLLMETGYNHRKASTILYMANITLILTGYFMRDLPPEFSIPALFIEAAIFMEFLTFRRLLLNRFKWNSLLEKTDHLAQENRFLFNDINDTKQ